jgi:cell division protein FtsW
MVVVIADLLSRAKDDAEKRKYFYWSAGVAIVTTVPILLNNLSTAVLIWIIFVALLFLARIQWKYILMCVFIPLLMLVVGLGSAKLLISQGHSLQGPFERANTWVQRIDEFKKKAQESKEEQAKMAKMTPEQQRAYEKAQIRKDMQNKNSQRTFSLLAVWRGGKTPLGVLPGNSKERDFLPVAYADYIFAIIVEEWGVIGAAFLMFLFLAILFRACYVSSRFDDYASMLMMMGLALMLTCQALISMMVVVGLGPVTGQPLPLITRGGTSAIVTSLYFGIMMCVSREQTMLRKRVSGTEEESKNDIPELLIMEPEPKEQAPELVIEPVITEEA